VNQLDRHFKRVKNMTRRISWLLAALFIGLLCSSSKASGRGFGGGGFRGGGGFGAGDRSFGGGDRSGGGNFGGDRSYGGGDFGGDRNFGNYGAADRGYVAATTALIGLADTVVIATGMRMVIVVSLPTTGVLQPLVPPTEIGNRPTPERASQPIWVWRIILPSMLPV
jgi:hypothetical protein